MLKGPMCRAHSLLWKRDLTSALLHIIDGEYLWVMYNQASAKSIAPFCQLRIEKSLG